MLCLQVFLLCKKPCKECAALLPAAAVGICSPAACNDSSCSSLPHQTPSYPCCLLHHPKTPSQAHYAASQTHPYHGFPLKAFPCPPESIPCFTAHRASLKRAGRSGLRWWPDSRTSPSAGLWPQQCYKAALAPPTSWHGGSRRRRVWQRWQPIVGRQGPPRQPGTCLPAALPRVLSNFLF